MALGRRMDSGHRPTQRESEHARDTRGCYRRNRAPPLPNLNVAPLTPSEAVFEERAFQEVD